MESTSSISIYGCYRPGYGYLNLRQELIAILALYILGLGLFFASMMCVSRGYRITAEVFKHAGSFCTFGALLLLLRKALTCCKSFAKPSTLEEPWDQKMPLQDYLRKNLYSLEEHPYFRELSLNDMFFPQKIVNRIPSLGTYSGQFIEGNRCIYIGFIQMQTKTIWQYNFILIVERTDAGPKCFSHPLNTWEIAFNSEDPNDIKSLEKFLRTGFGTFRNPKGKPWPSILTWEKLELFANYLKSRSQGTNTGS